MNRGRLPTSDPVRLRKTIARIERECQGILALIPEQMPAERVRRGLEQARWRIGLYSQYSEAGTIRTAETDVQALAYRSALERAAESAVNCVNDQWCAGGDTERMETLIRRMIRLHNSPVPTFPHEANAIRIRICEHNESNQECTEDAGDGRDVPDAGPGAGAADNATRHRRNSEERDEK